MRRHIMMLPLAVGLLTAACTDLSAVRDFATLSAETGAYRGVVQTFAEHPARMVRYRPQLAPVFEANRAAREAEREGLIALQETLTAYMSSLGKLAADETITFQTAPLAQAAAKAGAIAPETVAPVSAVADLLLRAAAGAWRQREVVAIIDGANAPLQVIVAALKRTVGAVADEEAAERTGIEQFYGTLERRSSDPAARQAMREWREVRDGDVIAQRSSREAFLKAIDAIGRGHQVLYDNRNQLSLAETIRQIRAVEAELKTAAALLRPLLAI